MQQATINLPSTHPLKAVMGLARQIALPAEFAPERLPSFPALERTATIGFNSPTTLNLNASVATKLMLFRQAAYPLWTEQSFDSVIYSATYSATPSYAPVSVSTSQFAEFLPNLTTWAVGTALASPVQPAFVSSASFKYAPLAIDQGTGPMPFIWVPPGSNFTLIVAMRIAVVANVAVDVTFEYWTSPGELGTFVNTAIIGAGSKNGAATPTSGGWWIRPKTANCRVTASGGPPEMDIWATSIVVTMGGNPTFTPSSTNMGSLTVASQPLRHMFPAIEPVEFVNSVLPWYSTRVTASAVLCTNVTQVLNKAGTVLAGRVAPQVISPWNVTSSYLNGLHPAEKSWLPLETGFYTYAPPSTDLVDFWDYTLPTAGDSQTLVTPAQCPLFRLDNTSLVNIAFFTAGSVAETLAITATWHLEFRTSSSLFQIALSGVQLESLHQAQLALASAGFFFENPKHGQIIKKVIAGVHAIVPHAINMVRMVNPAAAGLLRVGYRAMTRGKTSGKSKRKKARPPQPHKLPVPNGRKVVPATSAQASGIVRPKLKSGLDMYLATKRR